MEQNTSYNTEAEERVQGYDKFPHPILDNMLEGVQIIGFDWKYLYVNDAFTRHGKYSREEFLGHTVMERYPGIEQTAIYKVYCRCFDKREPIQMENRFVFPDGSVGWFELSFRPIPEGIYILSIDITDRKKTEENFRNLNEELEQKVTERTAQLQDNIRQLKESEEKFNKAFHASAAGISITRLSDSAYIDVNNAFAEITGFAREEIIGHTSVELGLIADVKRREQVLQQVRDHGSAKNFELTIRHRSGRILHILSSVETIILNDEKLAINIIYDITERKMAEEELASVNKELEAFSFSVSHDLRAPLRVIESYAKMLEREPGMASGAKAGQLLGRIQHNARKMSTLIDDLLAFSKLGRQPLHKSDLDMNNLVRGVIADLNKTMKNNAEIRFGTLHHAVGDHALVGQVMINLIANGIKYSSKKTNPLVEITSQESDKEVTYSVRDNGEGFDMKYADKLFGVFERLHTQDEFEGTGVGLAIVHRIIVRHGGRIWADAAPGVGATFSFSLPRK